MSPPIPQKIFHAEIVIDNEKVKAETAVYVPTPDISSFIAKRVQTPYELSGF